MARPRRRSRKVCQSEANLRVRASSEESPYSRWPFSFSAALAGLAVVRATRRATFLRWQVRSLNRRGRASGRSRDLTPMVGWLRTPAGIPNHLSGSSFRRLAAEVRGPYGDSTEVELCSALVAGQRRDPFSLEKQRICGSVTRRITATIGTRQRRRGNDSIRDLVPAGDSVAIVRNDSLTVRPIEGGTPRLVGTPPAAFLHVVAKWSLLLRASRGISLRLRPGLFSAMKRRAPCCCSPRADIGPST